MHVPVLDVRASLEPARTRISASVYLRLRSLNFERRLYSSEQYQNKNDYEDQPQTSTRIITPVYAIRPSRKGPNDKQDENNKQN